MLRAFGLIFLTLFVTTAQADDFRITTPPGWTKEAASLLASKAHAVVVWRKFAQHVSAAENLRVLQSELGMIDGIREDLMRPFGAHAYRVLSVRPLNGKYSGVEVRAQYMSRRGAVQVAERQYYFNSRVYQVLAEVDGRALESAAAQKLLALVEPTPGARAPASETADSDTSLDDVGMDLWNMPPADLALSPACQQVKFEDRVAPDDGDPLNILTSTGGCLDGLWSGGKDLLGGVWAAITATYQYFTDATFRDQAEATYSVLDAELRKDPGGFIGKIAATALLSLRKSVRLFPCYSSATQAKLICSLALKVFTPAIIAKFLTGKVLSALEIKAITDEILADEPALNLQDGAGLTGSAAEDAAALGKAEAALGRKLTEAQKKALLEAHHVGETEAGADGTPAGLGNYTQEQITRKGLILRRAGFTEAEMRELMDQGIAGMPASPLGPYDFSRGFKFPGLPAEEQSRLSGLLKTAVPDGQGGARFYGTNPKGMSLKRNWDKRLYSLADVAKKFFGEDGSKLKFSLKDENSLRDLPRDKIVIRGSTPGLTIDVDPAAGYFRVYRGPQLMTIVWKSDGTFSFAPSSDPALTHFRLRNF